MPSRLFPGHPVLEEHRNCLTDSLEQCTQPDTDILDILDLVLSTVGKLRALSNASNDGIMPSTIHFWSLLIRSLAFVCYDESYITQEAAFVRPRLSYVQSFMEDGHASLLIFHLVKDIQRPKPVANNQASRDLSTVTAEQLKKQTQEESDLETSYEDESSSEISYEHTDVSTDPTSAQSSYIPLDANILASWRHQNSVVLPFLCVTDEEDIFSLMRGVLYQRSTWGISEPVIGIILSNTGFIGRVVLGWLDKECPDPEALPAIRFAYGDETRIEASLGAYDLTDPVNGVKFSQFIPGLRAHVEGIVAQCRNTPTFKRISWRSDSIDDEDSGTEEQWRERIVNWLNAVAKCRAPSESSSSYSSFFMADSEERQTRSSSKLPMSADSKRKTPPVGPAAQFVSDADPVYPQEPSQGAARSKNSSEAVSIQSMERGPQEAQSDGQSYKTSKTASEIEGLESVAEEINEMLEFYEEMTRYMKPRTAKLSYHGLPVVDKRVEAVREVFRLQVDALPDGSNTRKLPQEFWEVISGSLSSLLWASVGGYSKEKGGQDHNEAEAPHEWDILLNLGFVNTEELTSGRVMMERALSLSRNVAADLAKSPALFDGKTFQLVADQGFEISHCVQDASYLRRRASHVDPNLYLQASAVINFALKYQKEVPKLFKDAAQAKHTVLKRNGDEPELGIVDAILTIPLEHGAKCSEPLVRITETRETVQAARTLHPNNIADPDDKPVPITEPPKSNGHAKKSKPSRTGSKGMASTPARMVAIEKEKISAQELPQETKKANNKGKENQWMHPFAVVCTEPKIVLDMTSLSGVVVDITALAEKLLLAVLLVEYKKRTQTYAKALVQAKIYLEASVRYLASLRVTKQAVFALATDGVEGAILMAWCSNDSERVYIVERNVRAFKISSPIEVYHLITVLLRLREYGDTVLKAAVEAALNTKDFKQRTWSKTAQFDEKE